MKRLPLLAALLFSALVSGTILLIPRLSGAAFNPNLLIDDALFNQSTSMSAAQIDSFLNGFASSCISPNSGFQAKNPSGYSPSGGFTYGSFASAGQVIATSAQVYGLNPRVLLVTLEKEQSLVTGRNNFNGYCNNGDEHKYAAAVGYGCPDGGAKYSYSGVSLYKRNGVERTNTGTTCVNSAEKAGFSQQVIRAAWLLKFGQQRSLGNINWAVVTGSWDNSDDPQSCYSGPMTQGYRQVCPSGSTVYYDGYKTIDGSAVHMDSGATAALYWYTPHFHGNQNFVSLYEGWFGSILATPFFKIGSNPAVYIWGNDNNYYRVVNESQLKAYGYGTAFNHITTYGTSPLGGMINSGNLPAVANFGGPEIYLFDGGGIRHFPDEATFTAYGYSFDNVAGLPDWIFSRVVEGPALRRVIKLSWSPSIYYMEGGKKRHFATSQAYTTLGSPAYSSLPSVTLNSDYINSVPFGPPIMVAGTFVKDSSTGKYFIWSGNSLQTMNSAAAQDTEISPDYTTSRTSALSQLTANPTPLNKLAKSSGGALYIIDKKKKLTVSSPQLANLGLEASDFVTTNDTFLSKFSTASMQHLIKIGSAAPVYDIINGQLYHIYDSSDFAAFGYSFNNVVTVNNTTSKVFVKNGAMAFKQGRLIKSSSSPNIYLVEGTMTKRLIPSMDIFSAYKFSASSVVSVSSAGINGYTTSGNLDYIVKDGSNVFWLVNNGIRRKISTTMLGAGYYNINQGSILSLSNQGLSRLKTGDDLTNFIKSYNNSKVYGIENGKKRWYTSASVFQNAGGNFSNITTLSASYVNSLPTGANIN